ncbi:MAG: hypothetical protein R3E31_28730 [Chloroflexota bacterium]|nr:hypothetical protein [Anaerolineales bacterium]
MKRSLFSMCIKMTLIASWLLVGCRSNATDITQSFDKGQTIYFSAEYIIDSPENVIRRADVIFVGKVISISPTRWNQDSGDYWEETTTEGAYETNHTAMPVHKITMEVTSLIADEVGIGETVVLTAIGKSPNENSSTTADTIQLAGSPDHMLTIGSEAVIFGIQTEIAWRDDNPIRLVESEDGSSPYFEIGRKTVIQLTPGAYLLKGDDGLFYSPENMDWSYVSLDSVLQQIERFRAK